MGCLGQELAEQIVPEIGLPPGHHEICDCPHYHSISILYKL